MPGRRGPPSDNDGSDEVSTYRRPEDAPLEPTDCPICFEALFDDQGMIIDDKDVAKIMCLHLVNSDCLQAAAKALNADGQRYGIGGYGGPQPVSMWECYTEAAAFSIFWMHRIQACLETIGPSGGRAIPVKQIKLMLRKDRSLTKMQKKHLYKRNSGILRSESGFQNALQDGNAVWVTEEFNGGPRNGGSLRAGYREGVWDWNKQDDTLWLHKWGPISGYQSSMTSRVSIAVTVAVVVALIAVLWRVGQQSS